MRINMKVDVKLIFMRQNLTKSKILSLKLWVQNVLWLLYRSLKMQVHIWLVYELQKGPWEATYTKLYYDHLSWALAWIDLVTVSDAILTSRETREKLQCLYENNYRKTAVLRKISNVN